MGMIFKRTKILATVGPKTNSKEMIEKLALAGVNGFRLNFSHGTYEERDQQIAWIRQASRIAQKPVAILQDLQGPKIRLGTLDHNMDVTEGDELTLDFGAEHQDYTIPVQYNLAEKAKPGERLYIFDGKIRTTVIEVSSETAIRVRVENAGTLMSRKGINLPDTDFGGDILTPKDLADIEFGMTKDIDFVAISFIQSANDIEKLRQILKEGGSTAQIIAKVETKAAIVDGVLEEIVKASDGVMVARGDLAVEAGPEVVPIVQRKIIALCRKYGRLSIVATQMMASMVNAPEPTRAEVNDISNAVIQGADVVMLSDETANGHYPIETIEAVKKVILYIQDNEAVEPIKDKVIDNEKRRNAISAAAISLAKQIKASALVVETRSGATAASVSTLRPDMTIICVTSERRTAQQLSLRYASRSYLRPDTAEAGYELAKELQKEGFFGLAPKTIVVVSGKHPGTIGATDTIKVRTVDALGHLE
jgi:pyruvate kinase